MAEKVLVNLATGLEDGERVIVAFLVAGAAVERGAVAGAGRHRAAQDRLDMLGRVVIVPGRLIGARPFAGECRLPRRTGTSAIVASSAAPTSG